MSTSQPSAQQPKKTPKWVTPAGALFVAVTAFVLGFLVGKDTKPGEAPLVIPKRSVLHEYKPDTRVEKLRYLEPYSVTTQGKITTFGEIPTTGTIWVICSEDSRDCVRYHEAVKE